MVALLSISAALVSLALRQVMAFQWGLKQFAERMAAFEKRGLPAISYQNSITPPSVTAMWLFLLALLIVLIAFATFAGGPLGLAISVIAAFCGIVVSGIMSRVLWWPSENTYFEWAFHSLANRAANYRRDGDNMRADAAEQFCGLLNAIAGETKIYE